LFRRLNNLFRKNTLSKFIGGALFSSPHTKDNRLHSNKGQVAIIIILVIAFALIFYAVSMNLGKLSISKTQTQVAAMAGASQLGSQMASYGQYLFQTQLGGK
jgi:hypothetical protein